MKIQLIATDKVRPYEKNPRKNDKAVDRVADSIKRFGFQQPIVVDSGFEIIAGHTRWKAAIVLGLTEVPCVVASDLPPDKVKAYRLVDNRTSEFAAWDYDLLGEAVKDLEALGWAPDDLGWDEASAQAFLASASSDPLPGPEVTGLDDRAGRFILLYSNAEEKDRWCRALGIDGKSVCVTLDDVDLEAL